MTTTIRPAAFNFPSFQRIAGNLFFIILLIYSIVYAAERVTYIDSAWQFFHRVNNETFYFPSGRFGVFFSEILLYLAVKIHLSFPFLVYIFSAAYILLYYFVWRICTYRLKNPETGLLILFCMFMGIRESFLHPVTETQQCIIYSALLFAILKFDFRRIQLKLFWICFATLLILYTHPIGVFTAGFACLFYIADQKKIKSAVWLSLGIILLISLIRFFFPTDTYDASQYALLKTSSGSNSFTDSFALHFITLHFTHFYWLPELAGLIVIIWLTIKKEWLKLAAVSISVIAYFVIACITFKNGDSSIMLERIFLPAFFMINLVLADLIVHETRLNKWILYFLVVFFVFNGIHYINAGCLMYKKRVAYLDSIVKDGIAQGHDAYFLSDEKTDKEKILVPWAIGTETLIYSKFKYNRCISISMKDEICPPGNCRLNSMLCLPVGELNQNYFHLSGEAYQELK
jgi:hypothetical protein